MVEVYDRLFVGAVDDCLRGVEKLAVVHACKSPCHQQAVGYRGSLPDSHPNYLVLQRDDDLYLNIIDPPVPLFKAETFERFLAFARTKYNSGASLLIHCNQGESRAPSLALLFLAKHIGALPDSSYEDAKQVFERLFPAYQPGIGIQRFLADNWVAIQ
jgi:protein-tyrosine phosphatase